MGWGTCEVSQRCVLPALGLKVPKPFMQVPGTRLQAVWASTGLAGLGHAGVCTEWLTPETGPRQAGRAPGYCCLLTSLVVPCTDGRRGRLPSWSLLRFPRCPRELNYIYTVGALRPQGSGCQRELIWTFSLVDFPDYSSPSSFLPFRPPTSWVDMAPRPAGQLPWHSHLCSCACSPLEGMQSLRAGAWPYLPFMFQSNIVAGTQENVW